MENQSQQNIPPVQTSTQPPISTPTNWSKTSLLIIFGLIIVAGLVFVGIKIGKNKTVTQQATIPPTITLTPSERPTLIQTVVPTNGNATPLKSCSFSEIHFEVDCPPDVTASIGTVAYETTAMIQYYGKDQVKNNPGWVDGFTINVTYSLLGQPSLHDTADQIRKSFYGGNSFILKTVNIGKTSGYLVANQGEGTAPTYIVVNGNNAYNRIDVMVLDPNNLGYKKVVDQILSTFDIIP
jgi:hypothetical protein